MTLNSNDKLFINGEITVKVENDEQSRYLIGLAMINGIETCFVEDKDYENYPYYAVEESDGELNAFWEPDTKRFKVCNDFDFKVEGEEKY